MKIQITNDVVKIVQISDVHISYPIIDVSKKAIEKIINNEQPDLIVFSGDLFHRYHAPDDAVKLVSEFVSFIDDFKTYFTFCFGNHDAEINITKFEIFKLLMESSRYFVGEVGDFELTRYHINDGNYKDPRVGNFYIDMCNSDNIITRVFMLDSGRYNNQGEYGSLTRAQKEFVESNSNVDVPSLIFFHIALPEFSELYQDYRTSGLMRENVCFQTVNCNLFEWALTQNNPIHISCGHDHLNDFSITKDNVTLNMCPGLCYEEYNENDVRGYLVFEIDNQITAKTCQI